MDNIIKQIWGNEVLCQTKIGPPAYLKLDWPSNVSKTDLVFQKKARILQEVNLDHFANESFVHDHLYKKLLPNLHQCSFVVGRYNIAGLDNLVRRIGFKLLSPLHFSKLVEHRKSLNECYKVGIDFDKNLVTLCTLKLSTERDVFVAILHPEYEQHVKTLLQHFILTLCWGDNVLLTLTDVEMLNILCNKLLDNVLTTWLSHGPNGECCPVNQSVVVKAIAHAVLDKEDQTSLNLDTTLEKMDGYLKSERQSLLNFNPWVSYRKDQLYIYTTDGRRSLQFVGPTPRELLRGDKSRETYPLKKVDPHLESDGDGSLHDSEGEEEGNDKKQHAKPNGIEKKSAVKSKGTRPLLGLGHKRKKTAASEESNLCDKHKERKVSPNLVGRVVNLGYLMQVPHPLPNSSTSQSSCNINIKVVLLDVDPLIKGVVKSYARKENDHFPSYYPGYMVYKIKPDGTQVSCPTWFPYDHIRLNTQQYTKLSNLFNSKDASANAQLILQTKHKCLQNSRTLGTRILKGCKKIDNVRARLNSKKGQFDNKEGLEIWEQCFMYVTEEVFPDYEEGNTGCIDHVWAMGIILSYVLCGYPVLEGTEDIKCYNNKGTIGPEVQPGEQERLERDCHTFPAKEWNRPCLTMVWSNQRRAKTEEEIIEKDRLQWYGYSTDDTGFYSSTDKRFPVMGNQYKKCMDEVQREDLNPFLYHFETEYDSLCNRNGHFVLTILDRCKLTNIALDYAHYELFPDHEKGNTYATNHIWGLGIILSYLLCGYPPRNEKADIHCYNTIGIGLKADLQQQSKMEMDGHSFPAKPWCQQTQPVTKHIKQCIYFHPGNCPCLTAIWLTDWWIMTMWYVIVKKGLKSVMSKTPTEEYTSNTEQVDEVKIMHKATERKWKKEEADRNKRNIEDWLHLLKKMLEFT
eukprot:jgi/Psemu1/22718/gm1.22718_g